MSTKTVYDDSQTPAPQFEDRLLATILGEFDTLTATPAPVARTRRVSRRAAWAAVPALATAAAAAVVVAVGSPRPAEHHRHVASGHLGLVAVAPPRHLALFKLADASVSAPALQGRYVVLAETDSDTDEPGQSQRTTVIDSQTGSSVTYQQPYADSGAPAQLTEGADRTDTEAWFVAWPTAPRALRARLLRVARAQQRQANAILRTKLRMERHQLHRAVAMPTGPRPTADDLVYEQANDMLWNPLTPPALRAALYKVLAGTTGFTVDSNATDPSGRPAVAMTRSTTVGTTAETDITYEDPSTGAVLAQVWKIGSDTMTAVYQPVTSTNTMPADPYGN
jgi:hypothetical protein